MSEDDPMPATKARNVQAKGAWRTDPLKNDLNPRVSALRMFLNRYQQYETRGRISALMRRGAMSPFRLEEGIVVGLNLLPMIRDTEDRLQAFSRTGDAKSARDLLAMPRVYRRWLGTSYALLSQATMLPTKSGDLVILEELESAIIGVKAKFRSSRGAEGPPSAEHTVIKPLTRDEQIQALAPDRAKFRASVARRPSRDPWLDDEND